MSHKNAFFLKCNNFNSIEINVAEKNPEKLLIQIENANILFFCGGNENKLKDSFGKKYFSFSSKLVVGVSAGANFLSSFYFSNDRNCIEEGLGIVPINTICHFVQKKYNLKDNDKPWFFIKNDDYIFFDL